MSMLVVLNNFIRKRTITKSRDDRSDFSILIFIYVDFILPVHQLYADVLPPVRVFLCLFVCPRKNWKINK